MSFIVMEVNYGTIDSDYSTCHGYYIIIFSSSPYTLQADLSIDGQVIYSGEIVFEGTYFFININCHYYYFQKNKSNNTIVSLRTIINGNVNVICYDSNVVVPSYLRCILQKCFSTFSPLYVPTEEHDNIMDENNQR